MLKTLPSEKKIYTDEKTGRPVWRMTAGEAKSHSCYQENEAFTDDEKYVVFSSNRTGSFQLYRAELQSGELAQLSDKPEYRNISFRMAKNGREALYLAGWRIWAVDVATGEERVVLDMEGKIPAKAGTFAISGDEKRCVVKCGRSKGEGAVLVLVGTDSGECREIVSREGKISHPQFCPGDNDLLTFVPGPDTQDDMSLPMEKRARAYIVDIGTGKERAFLTMPYGFRATHEYWDFKGKRFYFHKKTVPGWAPASICSVDRDGSDLREHFLSPDRQLGHSSIDRKSRFIVSDVQCEGGNELYRVDLTTGKSEILCWPDSSFVQDQTIHVHPSISAHGNYVDFTSDRAGTSDLYVIPLDSGE